MAMASTTPATGRTHTSPATPDDGGVSRMPSPSSGVAGLVWVLPVAGLVLAIAILVVAFRRWRPPPAAPASAADRLLVAEARRDLESRSPGS
jgi:hypothetical protein